jgi:light-regulated signal transduction histidine kinase (bacteriophytochrome)
MEGLITGLLTYARATTGQQNHRQLIQLGEPLSQALANLDTALAECGAEITHDPLPSVLANPTQMVQVFQNVLGNALKYRRPDVPPRIHVAVEAGRAEYILAVRDNGQGFKPEYAERIFGIFKRLHGPSVPGTGIGLAICKAIIDHHGGRIWAEASPGQGATLYFTLPSVPERRGDRFAGPL